MSVSEEMVEAACAAEQAPSGRYAWPGEWMPELAAEYRAGMRIFLSSIVPAIQAAALEDAARIADQRAINGPSDCCRAEAAGLASSIRALIGEAIPRESLTVTDSERKPGRATG